jgi:hypothetical protein
MIRHARSGCNGGARQAARPATRERRNRAAGRREKIRQRAAGPGKTRRAWPAHCGRLSRCVSGFLRSAMSLAHRRPGRAGRGSRGLRASGARGKRDGAARGCRARSHREGRARGRRACAACTNCAERAAAGAAVSPSPARREAEAPSRRAPLGAFDASTPGWAHLPSHTKCRAPPRRVAWPNGSPSAARRGLLDSITVVGADNRRRTA